MEVTVHLQFKKGDKVLAKNYRSRYGTYEEGTVSDVEVRFNEDLTYHVTYRIMLDRRVVSRRAPWGKVLWLSLSEDGLRTIR